MIKAIISPAKSLNEKVDYSGDYTIPEFLDDTLRVLNKVNKFSPGKLKKLMGISPVLAELNYNRFQSFENEHSLENSSPALLTFSGGVYQGINADDMSEQELSFAQDHLLMLSGFYGLLRPLDLIQPYRLEMGTKTNVGRKKNLYEFWRDKITSKLNEQLPDAENDHLINLASKEYFSAIDLKKLKANVITIDFREMRNGQYRFNQFNGKKARGLMTRFIIKMGIEAPEHLKAFDYEDYMFNEELSSGNKWVFTKG
jgi:cytoplasmic iron level regulating protein YaaA (DUF328/UPF0246 family)